LNPQDFSQAQFSVFFPKNNGGVQAAVMVRSLWWR
jgi:hypothetical protein